MSMTDPIADMLTRIRNGVLSRKARVEMPFSQLKVQVASILKDEGFIVDHRRLDGESFPLLQIELKWTAERRNAIEGLKRVSRPGQRRYVGKTEIPKVRGGQGIAILTTSKGVMTDRTARSQAVGGEILCEVW